MDTCYIMECEYFEARTMNQIQKEAGGKTRFFLDFVYPYQI